MQISNEIGKCLSCIGFLSIKPHSMRNYFVMPVISLDGKHTYGLLTFKFIICLTYLNLNDKVILQVKGFFNKHIQSFNCANIVK